jgi:hypothetical protein
VIGRDEIGKQMLVAVAAVLGVLALALVSGVFLDRAFNSCGGLGGGGSCAPRNDEPVPAVVGQTVWQARQTLERHDYGCAIVAVTDGDQPGHVVEQDLSAGATSGVGAQVGLTVNGPLSRENLSSERGCEDLLRGS